MKNKYEIGGKIRVGDEWHEITDVYPDMIQYRYRDRLWGIYIDLVRDDDYQAPIKDEWVTGDDIANCCNSFMKEICKDDPDDSLCNLAAHIQKLLQTKYGKPSDWVRKSEVARVLSCMRTHCNEHWGHFAKLGITPDMAQNSTQQKGGR